ncbi:MAG: hypothetical protein AAFN74_09555, partial [Myxococcota bacterium]
MTYRLACEAADIFAAVAVSAGTMANVDPTATPPSEAYPCAPSRPVSVLHVHGLMDQCVEFDGGQTSVSGVALPSVPSTLNIWRTANQCGAGTSVREGTVQRQSWSCLSETSVELVTVAGLGHAWAGASIYPTQNMCGGQVTDLVSSTAELWRFFQAHPRRM